MERREAARRLIVNADDFGRSSSINAAVVRAHRDGILTSASLMVNEPAFDEAVSMAKENPRLAVGLHLTLLRGHSTLGCASIPGLINVRHELGGNPFQVALRYWWIRGLHSQLEAELAAQFEKFRATGLPLDHVNGHLHLHLHPVVLAILIRNAAAWGIIRMRLTCDRFWLNARLARGRWLYRASHALVFHLLWRTTRAALIRAQVRFVPTVFGLLQDSHVDENYVLNLIRRLPAGDSELYSHPSQDEFKHELDALISPRVKELVHRQRIELIRYQDL